MRKTGKAFARGARDWWHSLALSPAEQLREGLDLALLDALDPLEASVETHVGQVSITPRLSPTGAVSAAPARPG
jgi:hypothetical protein